MYQVSADYLAAKNRIPQVHQFKLSGSVGNESFNENNVLKGSLSITNKCSNGNDILVGSVNIAVLKGTFIGLNIEKNADIVLSEGLKLSDGTYEYVPMGVYRVAEANTTRSGTEVTAYDRMSFFDKSFRISTTLGTPYELANYACVRCGVSLGMTMSQMAALPNGTETLTLYTENDIETWRDFVFWLAQSMACFAMADRYGNLVFCPYRQVADDTINSNERYQGASFSRFVVRYSGMSVVDMMTESTNYYGLPDDHDLTYNLGSNPFLQYGSDSVKERIRRNVLNGIANIAYTPFEAKVNVGALYDLGDIIQNENGLAENADIACVMRYVWKYNGGFSMEGVGKNPALASARSKMDKNIAGLLSQQKEDKIQFYSFFNAKAIHIADGETKPVIEIQFTANKQTTVVFHAEILMDVDTTVNGHEYNALTLNVLYLYDDVDLEHYKPKETWFDGNHILHLLYYFDINEFTLHNLKVLLNTDGASIDIGPGEIRASVWGQNLAAVDHWDGTITVREETGVADLIMPTLITGIGIGAESVSTQFITPDETTVTQIAGITTLIMPPNITVMNPTETISVSLEEVNT